MPIIVPGLVGGEFPYAETISGNNVTTALALSANAAVLVELPARSAPLTIAVIRFYLGTSSGNVDAGVYIFDGTTWTHQASSGSTAAGTTLTINTLTMTTPYVWDGRTRCYLAISADNATATFGLSTATVASVVGARDSRIVTRASSFPLASQFATATGLAGTTRPHWLRAAAA